MGPLVGQAQRADVLQRVEELRGEAELVIGDPNNFDVMGADARSGAFAPPMLLHCRNSSAARKLNEVEAFGPVCTIMEYDKIEEAVDIVQRGKGSLVASVYTYDSSIAAALVESVASFHGRLLLIDRDCGGEQTGHGSPMPQLVHGGPGRAGGGEELGGLRGMQRYMQRTALQGSPAAIARLLGASTGE